MVTRYRDESTASISLSPLKHYEGGNALNLQKKNTQLNSANRILKNYSRFQQVLVFKWARSELYVVVLQAVLNNAWGNLINIFIQRLVCVKCNIYSGSNNPYTSFEDLLTVSRFCCLRHFHSMQRYVKLQRNT